VKVGCCCWHHSRRSGCRLRYCRSVPDVFAMTAANHTPVYHLRIILATGQWRIWGLFHSIAAVFQLTGVVLYIAAASADPKGLVSVGTKLFCWHLSLCSYDLLLSGRLLATLISASPEKWQRRWRPWVLFVSPLVCALIAAIPSSIWLRPALVLLVRRPTWTTLLC
jgi:hypothetical protein